MGNAETYHPTVKYLVYYNPPYSNEGQLVLKSSLKDLMFLLESQDSKIHWVYKVVEKEKEEVIEKIPLEDLLESFEVQERWVG